MHIIPHFNADAASRLARRAATVLAAATVSALAWAGPAPTAHAASSVIDSSTGRHVSIALNKSIVVRLPVPARDVLIGNPKIVEAVIRTQNTAYLFAKGVGQTNAFFFDGKGRQIFSLDIDVAHDIRSLKLLLDRNIPGNHISVDSAGDNIVLNGTATDTAQARLAVDLAGKFVGDEKKVLSNIAISGKQQVMLRVRVAEVQRTVLKQLGINLTRLAAQAGDFAIRAYTFNPFSLNGSISGLTTATPTLGLGYNSNNVQLNAAMQAMERDGLMRTLAEPTLTAISGESAKFLAGGEFPVITGSSCNQGSNNICTNTLEFKQFGVSLGFSPVVLSGGRISLKVNTEVSELSQENSISTGTGASIPGLNVRRAETTVELPSGGSMVLAGLIEQKTKQDINGTPGLKDLPVLGALFRSRDFQSNQTELVVFCTPYLVQAVSDKQIATPLDRLNVPTDRQTILFGRLNKVYGVPGDAPKGVVYHGNVGFIVE